MAAIVSNGTGGGDWNAGATWAGGVVPGAGAADSVTIISGDTVSLNITTHANTVTTVTIDSGGKLTVDAQFNTDAKFTGNWSVTGEVEFKKTSGQDYELRIQGEFSIKSGGTLDMDSTSLAAGEQHILSCDSISDHSAFVDAESGSTIVMSGRTKTERTQLNGALTGASSTVITVDDDTGWEVGDEIVLIRSRTVHEIVTLNTDNGGGEWDLVEATVTNSYNDGGEAWNITRSCLVQSSDASFDASCDLLAGATVTAEYAQFSHLDEVRVQGHTLTGCTAVRMEFSEPGFSVGNATVLTTFVRCIIYSASNNAQGFALGAPVNIDTCYVGGPLDGGLRIVGKTGEKSVITDLVLISSTGIVLSEALDQSIIRDCHIYGCTVGIRSEGAGTAWFVNIIFGVEPGGGSSANTTDFRSTDTRPGQGMFDDCLFSGGTEFSVTQGGRAVSLNHNNQSGYTLETQVYGIIESNSVENRGSTYCDEITPSNVVHPVRYALKFPVASGATPTLTFYVKDSGTMGVMTVSLGRHRCGLTGVASGSPFTTTGTYAQKTVNFTGTTDIQGEVEVFIDVLDSSSGILYIDDIAISGHGLGIDDPGERDYALTDRFVFPAGGGGGQARFREANL